MPDRVRTQVFLLSFTINNSSMKMKMVPCRRQSSMAHAHSTSSRYGRIVAVLNDQCSEWLITFRLLCTPLSANLLQAVGYVCSCKHQALNDWKTFEWDCDSLINNTMNGWTPACVAKIEEVPFLLISYLVPFLEYTRLERVKPKWSTWDVGKCYFLNSTSCTVAL